MQHKKLTQDKKLVQDKEFIGRWGVLDTGTRESLRKQLKTYKVIQRGLVLAWEIGDKFIKAYTESEACRIFNIYNKEKDLPIQDRFDLNFVFDSGATVELYTNKVKITDPESQFVKELRECHEKSLGAEDYEDIFMVLETDYRSIPFVTLESVCPVRRTNSDSSRCSNDEVWEAEVTILAEGVDKDELSEYTSSIWINFESAQELENSIDRLIQEQRYKNIRYSENLIP